MKKLIIDVINIKSGVKIKSNWMENYPPLEIETAPVILPAPKIIPKPNREPLPNDSPFKIKKPKIDPTPKGLVKK